MNGSDDTGDDRRRRYLRRNRRGWDATSRAYERTHAKVLRGRHAMAWGLGRLAESELRLLGPVRRQRILELGCGAARWSAALARAGAIPVGIDVSLARLAQAAAVRARSGRRFALVRSNAERLPFRAASFDRVFCDWGAMTFSDPLRTVPEVARVLRVGGLFVFSTSSPLRAVAQRRSDGRMGRRLRYPYFGLHQIAFRDGIEFQLPYSAWIELFRVHGFRLDRLLEPRPPTGRRSSYLTVSDTAWGRAWPLETIWRLVRIGRGRTPAD